MNSHLVICQKPEPGRSFLRFRGDSFSFELVLSHPAKGRAWVRTNIGRVSLSRSEIIREVEEDVPVLSRDWFDIPMLRMGERRYRITLPLAQTGHFEGKCFFLVKGSPTPLWPEGENVCVNVSPAHTCCANIIYNTFVRQFGPNKTGRQEIPDAVVTGIQYLDQKGWSVIPPSGRFRDLIAELDFILCELGCRYLLLLPIHPTPTTYARMGRFGSPYAAQSFTAVDPALAEFDPKATPLEQFVELVDAVHARGGEVLLDIAINHTGWAASLHGKHPQWLSRDEEGRIEMPGAWGVTWADLTRLDYTHRDLWTYMATVFLTWCERGVDGFRCDAGYMIPVPAWRYIISRVREQFPETIFLLEGLGGKLSVTRTLLDSAGFDWAYSELFQNYNRDQIESYLPGSLRFSKEVGLTIHFSETHDNNRLAATSQPYSLMRNALCALFSENGGFGFAGGVEWFATEKINVHEATALNWGASENQVDPIRRLTALLRYHPAFHDQVNLELIPQKDGNQVALYRRDPRSDKKVLILANLDDTQPGNFSWKTELFADDADSLLDLLTGQPVDCAGSGKETHCRLEPLQVRCLSNDREDLDLLEEVLRQMADVPPRVRQQMLQAGALEVRSFYRDGQDISRIDLAQEAEYFADDPVAYCRRLNPQGDESRVVQWVFPQDCRREVMIPPGHFLLIHAPHRFRASLRKGDRTLQMKRGLANTRGEMFALFAPVSVPDKATPLSLNISIYAETEAEHHTAPLLFLPQGIDVIVTTSFDHRRLLSNSLLHLQTNQRGGMLRIHVAGSFLESKYDAVLAANLHPEVPEDRWIFLTRCRMWMVYQGYSTELTKDCLDSFQYDTGRGGGIWHYQVPAGQGQVVLLDIHLQMLPGRNAVRYTFFRQSADDQQGHLPDSKPVRIIIRPDIEDRNFHHTTKAYIGPEQAWPAAVTCLPEGFDFSPADNRILKVRMTGGSFVPEPEWYYMVYRPKDQVRGQDPNSDLFSPGFFARELIGGQASCLAAGQDMDGLLLDETQARSLLQKKMPQHPELEQALTGALDQYIVRRKSHHTVIAGYPWFLDWGRDSLIASRGLIAAGRFPEAVSILELFGQYEQQGTLPNMIHGNNAENRDTSDAPLWFFVACSELAAAQKKMHLYDQPCGKRSFREVLIDMGNAIQRGTPNGIQMDESSGLLFSPAHYTWMDTDHPAGTPRQGYPIEIQALWHYAAGVLATIDSRDNQVQWKVLQARVRRSIIDLFYDSEQGLLRDCLHADPGTPAHLAVPDDYLRPNQLFAVTLGAIKGREMCQNIVEACQTLLVPGAIRSLADQPVKRPLSIVYQGEVINNPIHPYWGRYAGEEDRCRKPAYHNGTAWTWVFPSFCEAWITAFGDSGIETAQSWLGSSVDLMHQGCVGHIPEILDGDHPHTQRGCDAQAWGTSEFLRVWILLENLHKQHQEKRGQV